VGEWKSRLDKVILTKTTNAAGIFATQVFVRGVPTVVVVDDFLPTDSTWGYLQFDDQAADGAVWGPLLEKVWAKVNANYENIVSRNSQEAFNFILGAPSRYYSMTSSTIGYGTAALTTAAANAWNLIKAADAANYVMGCGIGASNNYGLVNGHAYSLIGAYEIKNNNVVTNRLYRIRNPWGVDVYTGKWNDGDTASWTPSAQTQAGYVNSSSDGDFWIEDIDFVQAF
jgi:hypothetical protein